MKPIRPYPAYRDRKEAERTRVAERIAEIVEKTEQEFQYFHARRKAMEQADLYRSGPRPH